MSYGVNEVLLASVLGSTVFSIFAAQPLVIVGVTGKPYALYQCFQESHPYRTNHRLQLHGIRHHYTSRHKLLGIHVLDRIVRSPSGTTDPNLISQTDGLF